MIGLPNVKELTEKAEKVLADVIDAQTRIAKLERKFALLQTGLEKGLSGEALAQFVEGTV